MRTHSAWPAVVSDFVHRGLRISYREYGSGPQVVVLIHGLLMDGSMFLTFLVSLAAMVALAVSMYFVELRGKRLDERVRVMCRHLDLMIENFGEEHGCRMFRKVAPWYSKRFGPANEFNKRVVQVSSKAEFQVVLQNYVRWREQFVDENGELTARFQPAPMVASFMQEPAVATRQQIPVPKGPVEVW